MTSAEQIALSHQVAAEMADDIAALLAEVAKADQMAEVRAHEEAGDTFAAYWAGTASASVLRHYRTGAYTTVRGR
jgi:hypothetical protein